MKNVLPQDARPGRNRQDTGSPITGSLTGSLSSLSEATTQSLVDSAFESVEILLLADDSLRNACVRKLYIECDGSPIQEAKQILDMGLSREIIVAFLEDKLSSSFTRQATGHAQDFLLTGMLSKDEAISLGSDKNTAQLCEYRAELTRELSFSSKMGRLWLDGEGTAENPYCCLFLKRS